MNLQAFLFSHPGGRDENQDSDLCIPADNRGLFAVADGLGGHQGGQAASHLVTDTLKEAWETEPSQEETWLARQFEVANQSILSSADPIGKSTATALLISGSEVFWCSIGDTRLYLIQDGMIFQVSKDHSVTYKKYMAHQISRAQMNFDEDRSSLLRTLGDQDRAVPDTGRLQLTPDSSFLLCTDGFWEYLMDEEILADALKSQTPKMWGEQMLLRLMPRLQPGTDNLTFLTVMIQQEVI